MFIVHVWFVFFYRAVMLHGFTVDENGHKMSKSLGNVTSPSDVIYGNKVTYNTRL